MDAHADLEYSRVTWSRMSVFVSRDLNNVYYLCYCCKMADEIRTPRTNPKRATLIQARCCHNVVLILKHFFKFFISVFFCCVAMETFVSLFIRVVIVIESSMVFVYIFHLKKKGGRCNFYSELKNGSM